MKMRIMKAVVLSFMMIFTGMLITACGSDTKPEKEKTEETKQEDEQETNEKFGLNDTAVFENIKITALEVKESEGDDIIKPTDGKVFLGVKFKIENISNEDQIISSILLFNAYVDGTKTDVDIMPSTDYTEDGTLDGTLASGKNMEGYYVVQAPADWNEIQLDVKSDWLSGSKAEFVIGK